MANKSFIGLVVAYVLDWIIIIALVAIGAGFWKAVPNYRPFSPVDPDLSFPFVEHEHITTTALVFIAVIAPLILTAILAVATTSSRNFSRDKRSRSSWRARLWQWNAAWMGLTLGLALTFLVTEILKTVVGRPRPDFLARCNLDPNAVGQYIIGGFGPRLPLWNALISSDVCRPTDIAIFRDGYQSFPSGHSSFSWAGMFYLALYACSRFGFTIPYILPSAPAQRERDQRSSSSNVEQAAAPPLWLMILPLLALITAAYVASSRYSDHRHHGFDIIFGSALGILFSYFGFRLYQMPLSQSPGQSWGARSPTRAFALRSGQLGYIESYEMGDIENGTMPREI